MIGIKFEIDENTCCQGARKFLAEAIRASMLKLKIFRTTRRAEIFNNFKEEESLMISKQGWIKKEKYLKINDIGDYVIDYEGDIDIIDFHTHMSSVLPLKINDPNNKGSHVKYSTLPALENMDLEIPYWHKPNPNKKHKGLVAMIKFSYNGYKIFQDMIKGGTYDNCFKSQDENKIKLNVVLPISTQKNDRSLDALKIAEQYPQRFVAFCSVHPHDKDLKEKIKKYKSPSPAKGGNGWVHRKLKLFLI